MTIEFPIIGAESELNSNMRIYLNPASDIVHISLTGTGVKSKVHIIDISGKVLRVIEPTEFDLDIDISELANGVYFVQLRNEYQIQETQKLIKSD